MDALQFVWWQNPCVRGFLSNVKWKSVNNNENRWRKKKIEKLNGPLFWYFLMHAKANVTFIITGADIEG